MIVAVHVVAGVAALITGAAQVGLRKGTRRHRLVGRLYVAAMVVLLVSSVGIYELRDGPSLFHAVTVLAGVLVAAGWWSARQLAAMHHTVWLRRHLWLISLSYLALVVTFTAQFFDRLPLPSPAANAIVFLQIPMIAGTAAIALAERRRRH